MQILIIFYFIFVTKLFQYTNLNSYIMEVKVFLNSKSTKPVFCRIIPTNDALDIDFKVILSCMKILFGNDIIVQFTIA